MKVPETFSRSILQGDTVSIGELAERFDLKEITVRNYLSRMKREGLIEKVGTGVYRPVREVTTPPEIPTELKSVLDLINTTFPRARPIVWSTGMVSQFMHNVPGRELMAIDLPRDEAQFISEFLLDRGRLIFSTPSKRDLENFAWTDLNPIFIFKRGETMASIPVEGYRIATVDRIWVDLYYLVTRKALPFPATELGAILMGAYRQGSIRTDRLLWYSSRRGLQKEVLIILYLVSREFPSLDILRTLIPRADMTKNWIEEVLIGAMEEG